MKQRGYFVIVILLILGCTISFGKADLFTYSTSVYYTDTNASEAKQSAISLGRGVALSYILKKITLSEDKKKIDKLITPKVALSFNTGFKISNEIITKGAYQADITYQFSEKLIKDFLQQHNIKYLTVHLGNYLVFPTTDQTITDPVLAQFWKEFWQNIGKDSYLSNFSYYEPSQDTVFKNLTYLNNLHNLLQVDDLYKITLHKTDKHTYSAFLLSIFSQTTIQTKDFPSLDDLFAAIIQTIENHKKQEYLNSFSTVNTTRLVIIQYDDIKQWANLYNTLLNLTGIVATKITEIGYGYVKMQITFNVSLDRIIHSLAQQGMYLDDINFIIYEKSSQAVE